MHHTMRIEEDGLGRMPLPEDCLWGIHTARAIANFPITGIPLSLFPEFVRALAWVKMAAARANLALGVLAPGKHDVIVAVAAEIIEGRHLEHFRVEEGSGATPGQARSLWAHG